MHNNMLNAHGGYTPAALAQPYAIIPEHVLHRHHYLSAGAAWGTGMAPYCILPVSYHCFDFQIRVKGIKKAEVFIIFIPHVMEPGIVCHFLSITCRTIG